MMGPILCCRELCPYVHWKGFLYESWYIYIYIYSTWRIEHMENCSSCYVLQLELSFKLLGNLELRLLQSWFCHPTWAFIALIFWAWTLQSWFAWLTLVYRKIGSSWFDLEWSVSNTVCLFLIACRGKTMPAQITSNRDVSMQNLYCTNKIWSIRRRGNLQCQGEWLASVTSKYWS